MDLLFAINGGNSWNNGNLFPESYFSFLRLAASYAIATGLSRAEYEKRIRQLQSLVDALCILMFRIRYLTRWAQ